VHRLSTELLLGCSQWIPKCFWPRLSWSNYRQNPTLTIRVLDNRWLWQTSSSLIFSVPAEKVSSEVRSQNHKVRPFLGQHLRPRCDLGLMCKLMVWWLCWWLCVDGLMYWWLCWCADVLMCVDVLMIVLMWLCWWHCVDVLMRWWLLMTVLMCWCVDDCVDDCVDVCWCAYLLMTVLMCWCGDDCVDDCVDVLMTI
jgi:hypothetical protein